MKTLDTRLAASLLAAVTLALVAAPARAQAQLDLPRVSQKASASQTVGVTRIDVSYCRPGVKGRTIWGGLVPYNEVWRTGANEATTITFSDPVTVEGTTLPAGTYEFATIPGADEWTLIFNKDKDIWGAYTYKPEHDVLRIKVKPQAAEYTEWMTFSFPGVGPDSAEVALTWEKVKVAFTVKVDSNGITLARTRAAVAAAAADDWQTPYRAASYCLQNDVNTDEAVKWLEKSISVKQTFGNLGAKARYLAKTGDTRGAIETAGKAIEVGKAADPKTDTSALEKLIAEWKAKK
jgi:hypothetical protein